MDLVDGVIYKWVKPVKSGEKFSSLGEALVAQMQLPNKTLFFSPVPEKDPFFPYIKSVARDFFSYNPGRILISADYDVDGTTSATILGRAFRALGFDVRVFVPDRFVDNYGVNYGRMLEILKEWPYSHFVATDCGATELQGLAKFGEEHGITVAVVDHHKRGPVAENGLLEINPHMRLSDGVTESGYSAAIIAAMLIQAAVKDFPALYPLISGCEILAGLSAMADSASMIAPASRYYAKRFIDCALSDDAGAGVKALMGAAGLTANPSSTDVAFKVIPMINAAGRLRNADVILALFQEDDPNRAAEITEKLKVLNKRRRALQEEVQREAMTQYKQDDPVLIACDKAWHAGVVGPAAGQIAELLGIPVFLGGYIPQKKSFSFSGRTGSDTDIHALLSQAAPGLPITFGGHKVALGMKIAENDISCLDELRARLCKFAPSKTKFVRPITKVLRAQSISFHNTQEIKALEPFGVDNPIPLFCVPRVRLNLDPLRGIPNSLSGTATDEDGVVLPVLIFRNALLAHNRKFFGHMVGEMIHSTYGNASEVKFIITDLIPVT